jgi:hypothetical protein
VAVDKRARGTKRSLESRAKKVFRAALIASLFLHVPLLPTNIATWLSQIFSTGELHDYDDPDAEAIVPVDLDLLDDPGVATAANGKPGSGEASASNANGGALSDAGVSDASVSDAGASDAGPSDAGPSDAGPSDAGRPPKKRVPTDGGVEVASIGDAGADAGVVVADQLKDPSAAAGGVGKLASKDPNVQVLIAGECLKKHDLGPWFGKILRGIPEWNSFFEGTPIDPVNDLAHMLITGPQFRESSKIVAVMDYKISEKQMHDVVDALVKKAGGEWLEGSPVPAARAKVEGGDRTFALIPGKNLLVVFPSADAKKILPDLKATKPFSKSCASGIVISIKDPWRPFAELFALPTTVTWMRLVVIPLKDGGADVRLEAQDHDAENAAKHAKEVSDRFNAIRRVDLGITSYEVIDQVDFTSAGDHIRASTHASRSQLKMIMGVVEAKLNERLAQRKAAASTVASDAGGKN